MKTHFPEQITSWNHHRTAAVSEGPAAASADAQSRRMVPKRVASLCRCGWCSAHSRAPFPRAFGGGSKMRPLGWMGLSEAPSSKFKAQENLKGQSSKHGAGVRRSAALVIRAWSLSCALNFELGAFSRPLKESRKQEISPNLRVL